MEKGFLNISVIHARGFSNSIVFSFPDIFNISQKKTITKLLELNLAQAFVLLQTDTFCVHCVFMCGKDDVLGEIWTKQKREQDDV